MTDGNKGFIAEIKVLLQKELQIVKQAIHNLEVQMVELHGRSIERLEFERVVAEERAKREQLEERINELDKELIGLKASSKIYIGIASAVASLVASGVAGIIFSML